MWMIFGCWTDDIIWISRRILTRSASVSIFAFLIVLMATYHKINTYILNIQGLCHKLQFTYVFWFTAKHNWHDKLSYTQLHNISEKQNGMKFKFTRYLTTKGNFHTTWPLKLTAKNTLPLVLFLCWSPAELFHKFLAQVS